MAAASPFAGGSVVAPNDESGTSETTAASGSVIVSTLWCHHVGRIGVVGQLALVQPIGRHKN